MTATQIICVTLPVKIESEANRRDHWRAKAARSKSQKATTWYTLRMRAGTIPPKPPMTITLSRIGPRELDSDNLAGGFKACRDSVALWLGIDDGDKRLTWRYEQRRGKPKEYAAEVRIESEFAP